MSTSFAAPSLSITKDSLLSMLDLIRHMESIYALTLIQNEQGHVLENKYSIILRELKDFSEKNIEVEKNLNNYMPEFTEKLEEVKSSLFNDINFLVNYRKINPKKIDRAVLLWGRMICCIWKNEY